MATIVSNELHCCAVLSGCDENGKISNNYLGKWERLFHDKDDVWGWRVINWKANFDVSIHGEEVSPSDEEFKAHFESVLNPRSVPSDCDVSTDFTIPVLDCYISPAEVSDHVKNLSRIKPVDQFGISAGIFSLLPMHISLVTVNLFN